MPTSRNRGDSGTRFAQLELLEGRVLLSGGSDLNAQGAWDTHFIPWGNRVVEAVEDSWIMAFDAAVPHHVAMQRAQQVTAALGMPTTEIVPFAGNRYVRFESPAMMSRQQSEQVQNQFSFLRALQPNFIYHPTLLPNDPLIGQQYAVENTGQDIDGTLGLAGADMRLAEAWNISTGSLQVVIPIIDTGVDLLHPDLAANIWVNPGEVPGNNLDDDGNGFVDDVNGWDFTGNGDNNPTDEQGHGTAVAGCVGAIGNNGLGVAGVNWQVTLLPVKIFPAQGGASTQDIVEAVTYTTMLLRDFGVNIVASSNSYGAVQAEDPNFNDNAESLAIQEFTDAGGIFVAAAGNDTNDNDGPNFAYPASYNNEFIVSVAATDNRDELADFSNFGLTSVDVGAPGVRVMTTAMGGGYEYIDGTSFACPYTAGVLGLLASANAFASQQALRDALYQGVDRVAGLEGRVVTGGRVNAFESLKLVGFPGPIVSTVTPGALTGPVNQIQVQFSEPLNPAFFTPSGLELRGANGDRDFNANDVLIPFSAAFEPGNQVLTITVANGLLANDVYRVTLRHQFFRDMDGNFLNGTQLVGNDEEYDFEVVNNAGPFEPNDVLAQATPIIFGAAPAVMSGVIGDGANGVLDVDLYRLNLLGPSLITARIDARALESPSTLDSYLRLFDAAGREIARNDNFNGLDSLIQFFVPTGGRYYIGVTGFGNSTYSPSAPSSGTAGGSLGAYDLSVTVNTSTSEQVSFVNGIPVAIPATGTVSSSIFVPDVRPVQDVNVSISVTHTYVGDLRVRLISPSGKAVVLVLNRGGPGDNFLSTRFDDSAPGPISGGSAPFTGTFRPEEVLGDLNGDAAQGVWRLEILDSVPLNGGTLLSWQLDLRLENSISGPFEVNDTMLTATGLNFRGTRTFDGVIGDGAFGRRDVDMFRVVADAGTSISAAVTASGTLDAVLRLFDQQGNQLHIDNRTDSTGAFVSYPVQFAGVYFIAVSGAANTDYLPGSGGSGTAASGTGAYTLRVSIVGGISDGAFVLGGNRLSVGVATDGSLVTSGADQTGLNFAGIEFLNSGSAGESFYGATFNGFIFRNAGAVQSDLPVAVWNESDAANRRVSVEGLFRSAVASNDQNGGLLVRRSLSFGVGEQFIAIDVSLTNTTLGVLNSVAWVEGFKPVHPLNMGSLFSRTVTNRDNATGRLLTATFSDVNFPGGLTIGLGAAPPVGANFALSSEPSGLVRDAFQVIGSDVDPDPAGDAGTLVDETLAVGFDVGTLNSGATATFRYFIFLGNTLAEVQQLFALLEAGGGPSADHPHLVADPASAAIPAADLPYALYYPEGFANNRASSFVPVVNPNDEPARVVILARYETGTATQVLFDQVVPAGTRTGITISTPALYAANQQLVRKDTPFALEVRSSLPVGATLSHFDFGISTGQAFTSEASTTWTFGEGFKGVGVHDFLVFQNTTEEEIKVTLTVYRENSGDIRVFTQNVEGLRRGGWNLGAMPIGDGPFAVRVDAEGPIVAALTHFDTNIGGGFGVLGLPGAGSAVGLVPEGQLGLNAQTEFITILNPTTSPATVTFTFFFANQGAFRHQVTIPALRRGGFSVGELPGFPQGTQPYSVGYESDQPVSATLASYGADGGSGSRFTGTAASLWLFSDGFRPGAGALVREYLRLFNPSATDVTVEITMIFEPNAEAGDAGGAEVFRQTLPSRAAVNFDVHQFVSGERRLRDTFYSIRVKSPEPVVAFMGHIDLNLGSGFGTLGTALGNLEPAV